MKLTVSNLSIEYVTEGYSVRAVDDLSFEASSGELVVLLGPSGSGKTSLLSALAGILTPSTGVIQAGDIRVNTLDSAGIARYRRSTVGIVFQASNLIQSLSARENIAAPLLVTKTPYSKAMARADDLLKQVDLTDRASHRPSKLSGGQQARVALARGLAHDPPILLADEPTANLDYINAEAVISLLQQLRSAGRIIVVSTHDDRMVRIADRVIEMVHRFHSAAAKPERVRFKQGAIIFEQGSRGELVYQIESGSVDIYRATSSGTKLLATLEKGQYFGELGPMLGFPRSASAKARSDTVLTAFGINHFREMIKTKSAVPKPKKKKAVAKKKVVAKKKSATASGRGSRGR
ncbi:MAG: ATP-binding cassette domain-containing protein [Actinomycetota bacterium]